MIFLTILVTLVITAYYYLTYNFDYWKKRNVPAAKARILIGNLPNLLLRRQHVTYDFNKIYNEFKGKNPFIGIMQIRSPRLVVLEPGLVRDVLVRNFKNFHDNEFGELFHAKSNPLMARNPFLLSGEAWKEKRAEMAAGLTTVRLNSMQPVIEDIQSRFLNYVAEQIKKKKPLEVQDLCSRYTMDVASNTILGVDAQSLSDEKSRIREMSKQMSSPTISFVLQMMITAAIPPMKKFLRPRFMSVETEKFFVDLVEQAVEYRETNNVQREDFLDYMIQLKKKKGLTHIEIAAYTTLFFIDGFDLFSVPVRQQ